jgi:hypothetical protein
MVNNEVHTKGFMIFAKVLLSATRASARKVARLKQKKIAVQQKKNIFMRSAFFLPRYRTRRRKLLFGASETNNQRCPYTGCNQSDNRWLHDSTNAKDNFEFFRLISYQRSWNNT